MGIDNTSVACSWFDLLQKSSVKLDLVLDTIFDVLQGPALLWGNLSGIYVSHPQMGQIQHREHYREVPQQKEWVLGHDWDVQVGTGQLQKFIPTDALWKLQRRCPMVLSNG